MKLRFQRDPNLEHFDLPFDARPLEPRQLPDAKEKLCQMSAMNWKSEMLGKREIQLLECDCGSLGRPGSLKAALTALDGWLAGSRLRHVFLIKLWRSFVKENNQRDWRRISFTSKNILRCFIAFYITIDSLEKVLVQVRASMLFMIIMSWA